MRSAIYNGYIYILTNPSMKGLVKIGTTTSDPEERADKLSEPTGVPTKFVVAYQQFVIDCYQVEKSVHRRLKSYKRKKEFFRIDVNKAIDVVKQEAAHFPASKEPVKPTEAIETKPYPAKDDPWKRWESVRSELGQYSPDPDWDEWAYRPRPPDREYPNEDYYSSEDDWKFWKCSCGVSNGNWRHRCRHCELTYDQVMKRTQDAQKQEHDYNPPYSPEKLPTKSIPIWTLIKQWLKQ